MSTTYAHSYKIAIRSTLHAILEYCVRNFKLKENVLNFVQNLKNTEPFKEMSFWTEEEFIKFLSAVDEPRYKALFSFLYIIGCRKGEALSLTWNDINFATGVCRINKTLTKGFDDGKAFAITAPKTKNSVRTVTLPNNLIKLLENYKHSIPSLSSKDYVFGDNAPLAFNTLRMRFVGYIQKSGVPYIRIHDLRHSAVSYMINNGTNGVADVYIIAQRIGDNVEQIYKTYGHLFPKKEETILNSFNRLDLS